MIVVKRQHEMLCAVRNGSGGRLKVVGARELV